QQRQLLETGWLALENAGYDPATFDGRIGVFAGTAMNTYFLDTGLSGEFYRDYLPTLLGSDKDFLATRLSYKLGLQGPALTIQTACSTSLVAIHYAIQSLLSGESDMTLVAAAAVRAPLKTGHLYEEASVFTKDGRCRAFDADATGTIFGSGVGGVILKQAVKAEADGDNIRAIIRGSAVNNDGNEKSDFTAPSVSMQAAAITEAMGAADVTADSIDYVEAHGTGTYLGDPIEVAALTQAYQADTDKTGFAKIGSVKSNVGHLDAAAGMASLIKVVLSLENEVLPKTLHFEKPNPQIDFASTPFVPAAINTPWPRGERPRRAGITSLGMGGTNAHIIVEEGQPTAAPSPASENVVPALVLTGRTKGAIDDLSAELAEYLTDNPDVSLLDVAHSLDTRAPQQEKRMVHGADRAGLIDALRTKGSSLVAELTGAPAASAEKPAEAVFLFTGQGSQRAGMGLGLYRASDVFRDAVDRCAELFRSHLDTDIRAEMWPGYADPAAEPDEDTVKAAQARLAETWLTQPTLFTIEYALAQWWLAEGVTPVAMLGHSIGELTAAAVAEVMSLEHTIRLVSVRAQSMFDCEPGSMVAVEADEETIKPLLGNGVELAVQNGKTSLVLAGPDQAIERLTADLDQRDIAYRALRTSHAFHTASMEPAAEKVAEAAAGITMAAPKIPIISNISGTWYSDDDRNNPRYWADQVRSAVRFSDGLATLLDAAPAGSATRAFLELGPAATLTGLVTAHPKRSGHHQVRSTLPPRTGQVDDLIHAVSTRTWLGVLGLPAISGGVSAGDGAGGTLLRSLPGYPFGGKAHWFKAANRQAATGGGLSGLDLRSPSPSDWIHVESFAPAFGAAAPGGTATLAVGNGSDAVTGWVDALGPVTGATAPVGRWTADGFKDLLSSMESGGGLPGRIVYHWAADDPTDQTVELLAIGRALTAFDYAETIDVVVVTNNLIDPLQAPGADRDGGATATGALALGPVRVINAEMETISARLIDVGPGATAELFTGALAADGDVHVLANNHRWTPQYLRTTLPAEDVASIRPKKIAIVGGFGGIGLELARHFITRGDSVTLTSSRPVGEDHTKAIAELAPDGRANAAELRFGDQADVDAALASAADVMGGLDTIIHLGGVLDNALLAQKDPDSARPVLYPKVEGSLQLLTAAEHHDAELVLFSSIAATHPEAGQVDYSSATAFQQALARDHGRVRAIAYPAWTGTGMTNQLSADGQAKAAVSGVEPAPAIEALDRFLASDLPAVIVSPIPLEHLGLARKAPVGARSTP
ncbi:MAG: type I polyketide synthase, partial [Actinomycetota bacterium]